MMSVLRELPRIVVIVLCSMIAPLAYAAQCSDVFSQPDGVNDNLQASGNTLDLTGVNWANGTWPPSGVPQLGGEEYVSSQPGPSYELVLQPGAQKVIFVNGNLTIDRGTRLNESGSPDQLLIVVRGSLSIAGGGNSANNRVVINGLIYAAGSASIGNNVYIDGAVAAGGAISTGNRDVEFSDSDVNTDLLEGLCDSGAAGPVDLSANGESVGPVSIGVDDSVSFSADVAGCPPVPTLSTQDWRETWLVDGQQVAQSVSGSSSCSRSPLIRTDTFDTEGQYAVLLTVEYRNCFLGFFCGGWQEHGGDTITMDVSDDDALTCFTDDYLDGSLSADDWVTSVSRGNFTPSIVNGRLRMTEARSNQATAATIQREIPGAENLVIIEFDYYAYGGNGADGLAVVLSDARVTPQPGSYGGSLGYAQRSNGDPGFAGGWLGIGLDEFGNFSNSNEGRVGGAGFRRDAVAVRGAEQGGYRYLRGTGSVSPGIDQPGNNPSAHRYRVTVDSRVSGEALVSVERDVSGTGDNYQILVESFNALNEPGQPAVPENFLLSLTGSTGGSNNIHELDGFQLCALKLNPVGAQVDHFEILHDGVALTCQPETVTIRACATAGCNDNELFTDPVEATLEPTEGWQGGNPVTIVGGTGEFVLQNTVAGEVVLDVVGSQPSTRPQSVTLCQSGNGPLSSENCKLEFFASGLAFDIPDLTSHKPSGPIQVQAVRQDDASQACVPAFENVEREVHFWSTYVDPGPGGRPVDRPLSVNNTDISGDESAPTPLNLSFGDDGIAEIEVSYPDAGRLDLGARYDGSPANNDEGLSMPGSDAFVSTPAGFCVSSAGACAAGDSSCDVFVRADEPFDLSITAVGWQSDTDTDLCDANPVTPNFRMLTVPIASELVAPSGGVNGTVSPSSYSHSRSLDATETVSVKMSEVGVFRFTATPVTGGYLGKTVPKGTSAPTGRFYPDRFNVTIDEGALGAHCGAPTPFNYTGQDISWLLAPTLTIEALSMDGARTRNYTEPGFQKLVKEDVIRTFPVEDSSAVNRENESIDVSTNVSAGELLVAEPESGLLQFNYAAGDTVRYLKVPEARVAPLTPPPSPPGLPGPSNHLLTYGVTDITDADGVSADDAPYKFSPAATFDIRFGRLSMDNVYGPENVQELRMPFRLEYWNGSRYVTNTADNCTSWTTATISSAANHHTLVSDSGTFAAGEAGPLRLQATGSQGTDRLTWTVDEWLREDSDEDGTAEAPSALATFGVYRGHDRVIYWQEK
ncbi:hypothetical protein LL273_19490 [Marinobacter salarius]|jgi:MSHA biogenesis protein MshQ|uniref:DUF6701 domain-containing protein n=1 Tax=Marinobacter TaxID=2742 RepID=UPI001D185593|nr:DUF6701 domain-containing protein [Marinobacter salarius]MCC4285907.1 hypothetical protein [Marinobacter salarius]|tara:strand:- start:61 stop:3834 length:3774 start_codon:yes stop_codon:yes gene_type:complete